MRLNSLAFKILLAYVTGALLSVSLLLALSAIVKERLPGMALPDRTLSLASNLNFDNEGNLTGFNSDDENPAWLYDSLGQETAFRVLDKAGNIVLASPGAAIWPEHAGLTDLRPSRFEFERNGIQHNGATEAVHKNGKTWFVQLTVSSRIIDFLHKEFALPFIRLGIIMFSLVLLFVFGICTYVILRYSLNPLRKASSDAESISPRSISDRLMIDRVPSEITPLIVSFNSALDRLESGYRIQQDFLAQAAHELKTPLTLIRSEVELMETNEDCKQPLLAHVEHLARHVQQLLLLAEASESLSYHFATVNVNDIARDTINFLQTIADKKGINLTASATQKNIHWHADRGALFTLLKNLIENAIQHAPVDTTVKTYIDDNTLLVRDFGPGVDPKHLSKLFSRFWRGEHRRDQGAGLGLSICKEICTAHNWSLSAENGTPGLVIKIRKDNS